eukprot:TRINITY_DN4537_c0_g1_i1.p1 TRINITY_DN4537_c0_g1~~TRINITY_DN4537_c0_g1_i1.p1  ORF type:complete len:188 (+),score=42.22 TRINITY_DN4537_c0_g1_i1:53-616(+)
MRILLLISLLVLAGARQDSDAHLLVLKSVDPSEPVADQHLTVSVNVFNVGKSPAFDVEIDDSLWPAEGVVKVEGENTAKISKILAGSNQTHTYVIKPQVPGELNTVASKVVYKLEPEGEDAKVVHSNTLPVLKVLTQAEYDKLHTKHYKEWFTFFVLSLIPVGLPGCMFMMAQTKLAELDSASAKRK